MELPTDINQHITAIESEGRILFSGPTLALQRLKSLIAARIGVDSIIRVQGGKFSVTKSSLPLIQDLIPGESMRSAAIVSLLELSNAHLVARGAVQRIIENTEVDEVPDFWTEILDPAQAVAVNAMTVPGLQGFCLFDEQGSGKTVMVIAAFDILLCRKDIETVIIICPKTMTGEWKNSIQRFTPDRYSCAVIDGTQAERFRLITAKSNILIANFEQLPSCSVLLAAVASGQPSLLVVDESYYIKNPDAQRSSAVMNLRKSCKMGFVLCGTPAPNAPSDIVHQFTVADNGITFPNFISTGEAEQDTQIITGAIEERGVYLRRQKHEILSSIPEKCFKIHSVPLSGRQSEMYRSAENDLLLELRSLDNKMFKKRLAHYFQRRSVLLRLCACPESVDPLFTDTSAKLAKLDEIVADILSIPSNKLVIWSFYTSGIDAVCSRFASFGIARVDGSVTGMARTRAVAAFQTDPDVRVFVGNPAAAGAGITLHAAADAIYLSYSNQAAHHLQSIDRIHRRGQLASKTTSHLIVCADTIEETEVRRLRNKERAQANLLGDAVSWPADIDDAISELIR